MPEPKASGKSAFNVSYNGCGRRHAADSALDRASDDGSGPPGIRPPGDQASWRSGPQRDQAKLATTSCSVGKRPVAFLEKAGRPSTTISKTPPPLLRKATRA